MAAVLSTREATGMLVAIGFDNAPRSFATAFTGFQQGWNLGPALDPDGRFGTHTSAALAISFARQRKGLSTMSPNFSYVEFRCNDGGRFPECRRIWMLRDHIRRLEAYRVKIGAPVRIVSGCRCKRHNAEVGGAKSSQHMFGTASDIQGLASLDQKKRFALFAGLGFQQSTGRVVHVDSRDKGASNLTGGKPTAPTTWRYST
ncbi:D-Ala-D-Ala carboxypeptidase family metallohydrolase [Pedococcus sp. 5OH_020]|uniref:D-Ala-D-Ala carboxypeptidase family metallohydrolase n=1 Tax=Pedococcus sp. 5OH_020 TaxID=2989814 RepID=UPI0022E9D9C8|nr:D-Ala-D-Ala carboxypeptidase family metallohydrolase [Pedococcus sp. 5OH_020]